MRYLLEIVGTVTKNDNSEGWNVTQRQLSKHAQGTGFHPCTAEQK